MNFEEALAEYRKGKKIRRTDRSITFTAGEMRLIDVGYSMQCEWEVLEEPKPPKLLAPAIYKITDYPMWRITKELYCSKEDAIKDIGTLVVQWPALPDSLGFYSVEQE